MKVCLLKFYGWPESFNERVSQLAKHVEEIVIIKPRNVDPSREPTGVADNVSVISMYPSRRPVMKPRYKTAVLPLYTFQAIVFYLWFAMIRGHCDVFHSFDRPFASLAASALSTITGRPHVASVRGMILPRYESQGSLAKRVQNRLRRLCLRPLIKLSLYGCDHIVTKAKFQQSVISELANVRSENISTIPTGVDYETFTPSATESDCRILSDLIKDMSQSNHVVLFLGKLVPGKGADVFVEHALNGDYPDDIQFLMVGDCLDRNFERELNNTVAESESGSRTTIHANRIPFEDIPGLIREVGAVALLSRSRVEGVPRVLQEACVSETPIIAADVDGIAGAFKNKDGCYLVDRNSTEEFQEAVLASRGSNPDRNAFRDILDINRNYAKYSDIYESVSVH
jgi:glycosyltransferase involved in cell wall biosynthesis